MALIIPSRACPIYVNRRVPVGHLGVQSTPNREKPLWRSARAWGTEERSQPVGFVKSVLYLCLIFEIVNFQLGLRVIYTTVRSDGRRRLLRSLDRHFPHLCRGVDSSIQN